MSVITEVKSGVLVLIVFHLAAFAMMVGYRMHTQQYYIAEAAIARDLAREAEANALIAKAKKKKKNKNATIHNPLEKYGTQVQLLSKSVSEAQESIAVNMEALGRHAEKLKVLERNSKNLLQSENKLERGEDDDNNDDDNSNSSEAGAKLSLSHWRELLSIGSLREIPDDGLKNFFDNAVKDITTIVRFDEEDYYRNNLAEQFLFDTGLGANIVKEPSEFVCPVPSTELMNDSDDDNDVPAIHNTNRQRRNDTAYESDLERYVEIFEQKFGNRIQAQGINALLPESIQSAGAEFVQKLDLVLDEIFELGDALEEQVEENEETAKLSCIDPELITAMVSAGLNAQTARADVQEALRKSILQYDEEISVEDLIMDADLGGTGTCGGGPRIKSINLRSVIDTPLLIKSIDWVDAFVDTIGGYSDVVDQYLDSTTGLHGTTSVGEIFVESVLEQAGRVGDINVGKYSDKVQNIKQAITGSRR